LREAQALGRPFWKIGLSSIKGFGQLLFFA